MSDITPVERAARLYATALQESRGRECSEQHFNVTSKEQALAAVTKLLTLEGNEPVTARDLAEAGKLLADAKRHGRF